MPHCHRNDSAVIFRTAGMPSWVRQHAIPLSLCCWPLPEYVFSSPASSFLLGWKVLSKVYFISFAYRKRDSQCCNKSETLLGKGDFSRKLFSNLLLLMHHHFNLFFSHISCSNKTHMKIISQRGNSQCCSSKSYTSSWKRRFPNKLSISQCSRYFLRLCAHLPRHHFDLFFSYTVLSGELSFRCEQQDGNSQCHKSHISWEKIPSPRNPHARLVWFFLLVW